MTDLDGPSPEEHPRPSHIPDIEYEDEPPGSYLGEFRIGWWKIAWSVINVVLAAAIGAGGETARALEGATPLLVAWALLRATPIRWPARIIDVPTYAIGGLAVFWVFERTWALFARF